MPKVMLYATLRKVAGTREVEVQADSVKRLLERLSDEYGGKLDRHLKISTILVNGKNVIHLKGKRTRLKPGDVVSIFPPMGGG